MPYVYMYVKSISFHIHIMPIDCFGFWNGGRAHFFRRVGSPITFSDACSFFLPFAIQPIHKSCSFSGSIVSESVRMKNNIESFLYPFDVINRISQLFSDFWSFRINCFIFTIHTIVHFTRMMNNLYMRDWNEIACFVKVSSRKWQIIFGKYNWKTT